MNKAAMNICVQVFLEVELMGHRRSVSEAYKKLPDFPTCLYHFPCPQARNMSMKFQILQPVFPSSKLRAWLD